jgi:hypothetical protein
MARMLLCPNCGNAIRAHEKDCPSCFTFCGFPNVRKAEEADEVSALEQRYASALAAAHARGCEPVLVSYESAIKNSVAVVCRSLDQTVALLSSDNAVYTTFYRQRSSGGRRPEDTAIETHRAVTDQRMFPYYYDEIQHAALSVDGRGVLSFGRCCLVLKPLAIEQRTSAFWENSVDFCNRVCPDQNTPIPPGFRASWARRAKLAVAKAEPLLDAHTAGPEFSRILLEGTRFIEVHIYGPFNRDSLDRILVPRPSDRSERAMLGKIRDVVQNDGLAIKVEEYS